MATSSRVIYEPHPTQPGGLVPKTIIDTTGTSVTVRNVRTGTTSRYSSTTPIDASEVSIPELGIKSQRETSNKSLERGRTPNLKQKSQYEKDIESVSRGGKASFEKQSILTKPTPEKIKLFGGGSYTASPKLKTLSEKLSKLREKNIQEAERIRFDSDKTAKRIFKGTVVAGVLGAGSGVLGAIQTVRHPLKFLKNQYTAIKNLKQTLKFVGESFTKDPSGVAAEYFTFVKTINLGSSLVKKSPVGRFVAEETFIRNQPKDLQPFVRKIIKSSKVQESINPNKIKSINNVDLFEVKTLNSNKSTLFILFILFGLILS